MKELPRIESVWAKLDAFFEGERQKSLGHHLNRLIAEQVINDQAYFILCWGQLESEINTRCRDAVRRRRLNPDWRVRRAWDLYNPDEDRFSGLPFENRVRLVLDARAGKGSAFALTMKHYNLRNSIAHGALQNTRIGVSDFVRDCYLIQTAL